MMSTRRGMMAVLALALTACAASDDAASAGSGAGGLGGAGAGGAPIAGTGGSGGVAGIASAGTGGTGGAGISGVGGSAASGGSAGIGGTSGGMHAGAGGVGGVQAGSGAMDSGVVDAGVEHVPVASAGCGKSGRPSGGLVAVAGSHIYWFPESYDGQTPMPLIMAFHAAGNDNDQLRNITEGSALAEHFVMAFPKSVDNGWSLDADSDRIDARFEDITDNHCIDTSRVFATGHSSGAQLIVQMMCRGDDRYVAIAPVASSAYCPSWDTPVPALIIHGDNDMERAKIQDADGQKDLAPYLASSGCSMETQPYAQAGCSSSGTNVTPGCVQYEGCSEPTIWCQHDDPQYGTSNHGWPCFANEAIDRFFSERM